LKVGTRQQQSRIDGDRKGTNPREICPACKDFYLKTFFIYENKKWVKFGKVCPNENCTFSKKD